MVLSSFVESFSQAERAVNGVVWGWPMMILFLGVGLWLTVGNGFVQFIHFGYVMKNTLGKVFKQKKVDDKGAVTPFQAVSTALASTVGTGNIAGVAGAIAIGGPGAVFWMWISALLGMATKFSEVVLAIHFRERNPKGDWIGGPMFYISKGLGRGWKWLAVLFAIIGALTAFGIGNLTQLNSIAGTVSDVFISFSANPEALNIGRINLIVGIVVAIIMALILFGGIKRIGATAEKIVPFMAILYIVGGLAVIITHISSIGPVFRDIFTGAFGGFQPIAGGVAGFAISETIKRGISRGVFSNEAGLGSAPIAHAAAHTKDPVQQGLYGILEVFLDTIVICSLTSLIVLMSGTPIEWGMNAGAELTTAGLATVFGAKAASLYMAIALGCFAFTTVLGWSLYGTRCIEFLFGVKAIRIYQIIFVAMVVVGATMELDMAWNIAETLNGMMAIPNLIGLALLSPLAFKLTKNYFARVKAGEIIDEEE